MASSNETFDFVEAETILSDKEENEAPILKPTQSIDFIDNYVEILHHDANTNDEADTEPIVSPITNIADSADSSKPAGKRKLSTTLNKKRIIFIRHAKSTWNAVSEKSNVDRVSVLTKGIFESMYNKSNIKDGGKYIDAPLSNLGVLQSMDLNRFIQHHYTQHTIKHILKAAFKRKSSKSPKISEISDERKEDPIHLNRKSISEELDDLSPKSRLRKGFQKLQDLTLNNSNKMNVFVFDNINVENTENDDCDNNNNNNNNNNINKDIINDNKLRDRLIDKDLLSLIGIDHNSCVVTSNLRRAIDTGIIGLSTRWQTFPLENMHILSCLQEFGKGPDCYSKTDAKDIPKISHYTQNLKRINLDSLKNFYSTRIDPSMNYGPKKDDNISRFDRMLEFCRYIFQRSESTIIVVGHSIWFQRFCKIFLLQQNQDKAKKSNKDKRKNNQKKKNHISILSKLYNTGCVGFDLCRIVKGMTDYYGIDSRTMVVIYKGFEKMDKISNKQQT